MGDSFETALSELLQGVPSPSPDEAAAARGVEAIEPVLGEMIYSFMLWETTSKQADAAVSKLLGSFIDLNELRISLPDELADLLGGRFSRGAERTLRLRMALNQIFLLEHEMSLSRLHDLSKRDARQYLVDLPGMPSFVASRVSLLALGAHAFPVDDRLRQVLMSAQALDPQLDCDQASAWLERQFRAGEATDAYMRLEAMAEAQRSKSSGSKLSKKSATKSKKKASPKRKSTAKQAGKAAAKSTKSKPRS